MLTAQQRVELALPAVLAWSIAKAILRDSRLTEDGRARGGRIIADLAAASLEPFADLLPSEQSKLKRRVNRLSYKLTGLFVAEEIVDLMWALHEALRILCEADALVIIDGGAFDLGWSGLTRWCFEDDPTTEGQGEANARLFDGREGKGRKMGHRLLAEFQREGLYRHALGSIRFGAAAAA
jgi:hypothetical protein